MDQVLQYMKLIHKITCSVQTCFSVGSLMSCQLSNLTFYKYGTY